MEEKQPLKAKQRSKEAKVRRREVGLRRETKLREGANVTGVDHRHTSAIC